MAKLNNLFVLHLLNPFLVKINSTLLQYLNFILLLSLFFKNLNLSIMCFKIILHSVISPPSTPDLFLLHF